MSALPRIPNNLRDDVNMVKELIKSNNGINQKYWMYEETLLHWAARSDYQNVAKYLVEAGADIEALDSDGVTPLYNAILLNNLELARYLIDLGADTERRSSHGRTAIGIAVSRGQLDIVRYIESREQMPTKGVQCDS